MNMAGNSILITGGATGIGLSLAKYFHERGNKLLICSRREEKLAEAAKGLPGILTFRCDVTQPADRAALLEYAGKNLPAMNILINNAGVQRDIDLTAETESLDIEIHINLIAPICLSALFTPMLGGKDNAAIINVSSGLAFMPERSADMPVYTATKAALHNFSIAQRIQLAPLGIRVIEMIPPAVVSELNMEGRTKRGTVNAPYMMSSDDYVRQTIEKMEQGMDEIRLAI